MQNKSCKNSRIINLTNPLIYMKVVNTRYLRGTVKKFPESMSRDNRCNCQWEFCCDISSRDIVQSPLLICGVLVYSVNKFKLSLPVVALKMALSEQRANIKFCVLLQKSPCKTLEMLNQAYQDEAMK
uniref:Uncharacterized protein n=1 Tax=Clastoptera arizonana TaxID=38151 RepID=A0A1B6C2Z2_9HEMI